MNRMKRKAKLESITVCCNCERLENCHKIGEYEECSRFKELKNEVWTLTKL